MAQVSDRFCLSAYILKQQYPDYSLLPLLVLPDKSGSAQTSGLPQLLNVEKQSKIASNIPIGNQQLLAKLDVSEPISQLHNSSEFARKNLPKASFSESLDFPAEGLSAEEESRAADRDKMPAV